ncbi:hypothetical protein BHE74_00010131 [Ensete ventricosum]|nr:hypothetical protein BHE74_00010131 [Ensete ventricosum]
METTIPSLITSSSRCPDWVGGSKEPLVSDLKENLCPSRVKWDRRRPKMGQLWPVSSPSESSRGLSLGLLGSRQRSDAAIDLGRELTMKLSSNSFTSESKEEMDDGLSRLYHIRAEPLRVVGKAQHIRESEVSQRATLARKAAMCSDGSELPSLDPTVTVKNWSGPIFPHCRVAPFELVAIGAFLAVVLTEGRPTVEMPTSASTGECAGRWFASSQSMPGPGG